MPLAPLRRAPVLLAATLCLPAAGLSCQDRSAAEIAAELAASGKTVEQIVAALDDAGHSAGPEVAQAVFGAGRRRLVVLVQALKDVQRMPAGEVALSVHELEGVTDAELLFALRAAQYDAESVARAAREIGRADAAVLQRGLARAGTPPDEIGRGLAALGEIDVEDFVAALHHNDVAREDVAAASAAFGALDDAERFAAALLDGGYAVSEALQVLAEAGRRRATAQVPALLAADVPAVEIVEGLFGLPAGQGRRRPPALADVARALHDAGLAADEVAVALQRGGSQDWPAVAAALDAVTTPVKALAAVRAAGLTEAAELARLAGDVLGLDVDATVHQLAEQGFAPARVVEALRDGGVELADVAAALEQDDLPLAEIARALHAGSQGDWQQVAEAVRAVAPVRRALPALAEAGVDDAGLLAGFGLRVFTAQARLTASLLDDLGFGPDEIAAALVGADCEAPAIAAALEACDLPPSRIASALHAVGAGDWRAVGAALAELQPVRKTLPALAAAGCDDAAALAELADELFDCPADLAAGLLDDAGFAAEQIATALATRWSPAALCAALHEQVVADPTALSSLVCGLGLPLRDCVSALVDVLGRDPEALAAGLHQGAGIPLQEIAVELLHAGISAGPARLALRDATGAAANVVAELYESSDFLQQAEAHAQQVAERLKLAGEDLASVARTFTDAGYLPPGVIGGVLHGAGWQQLEAVASGLKGAGWDALWIAAGLDAQPSADPHQILLMLQQQDFEIADIARAGREIGLQQLDRLYGVLRDLGIAPESVAAALGVFDDVTEEDLLELLLNGGVEPKRIGAALQAFGVSGLQQVVAMLQRRDVEGASIVQVLQGLANPSGSRVVELLQGTGLSPKQTVEALLGADYERIEDVASWLRDAGCAPSQVFEAIMASGAESQSEVVRCLSAAGFELLEIARALQQSGLQAPGEIARLLKERTGEDFRDIATTLRDLGFACSPIAQALQQAGGSEHNLAQALKAAGFQNLGAIKTALEAAGFTSMPALKLALSQIGAGKKLLEQLFGGGG